ncbi:hypothetical protein DFA_08481 [Cavenderia fasciculata]|uniref:EGF-like domain-containing protein n=1 Tax=Cavenderia fasciculata TaxID=261658 RepID=F4Q2L8_CACFS|nr:uncharacterized protein DFA_08481 [Cavenderia fasciculata]EGG17485.1 hypothetical protein DFA_08481 [Cavenderia fasciculata]|eukprot:XP_004355969.1 hypothetical protein DFA_08481 [Cavenderia fasciculata]
MRKVVAVLLVRVGDAQQRNIISRRDTLFTYAASRNQCDLSIEIVFDQQIPSFTCPNCALFDFSTISPDESINYPNAFYRYEIELNLGLIDVILIDDQSFQYNLGAFNCVSPPLPPYTIETFDQRLKPSTVGGFLGVYHFLIKEFVHDIGRDPETRTQDPFRVESIRPISISPNGTLFEVYFDFDGAALADFPSTTFILNITSIDMMGASFGGTRILPSGFPLEISLEFFTSTPRHTTGQESFLPVTPFNNTVQDGPLWASILSRNFDISNRESTVRIYPKDIFSTESDIMAYPVGGLPSNATLISRSKIFADSILTTYYFDNFVTCNGTFFSYTFYNPAFSPNPQQCSSDAEVRRFNIEIDYGINNVLAQIGSQSFLLQHPFGVITNPTSGNREFKVNLPAQTFDYTDPIILVFKGIETTTTNLSVELDTTNPTIDYVSYELLPGYMLLITASAFDDLSGIKRLCIQSATSDCAVSLNDSNLISGDRYSGIYQTIVPMDPTFGLITAIDRAGNIFYSRLDHLNNYPPSVFSYDLTQISTFYFTQNIVDVSNSVVTNSLVINFTNLHDADKIMYQPTFIILNGKDVSEVGPQDTFRGVWVEAMQAYVITFTIPKSMFPGTLKYYLPIDFRQSYDSNVLYQTFGNNALINILSNGGDLIPPQIVNVTTSGFGYGFIIQIEDEINGFMNGTIYLGRLIDPFYNFSQQFDQSNLIDGTIYRGSYQVQIPVLENIVRSEIYTILAIETVDLAGISSNEFIQSTSFYNPIIPILNVTKSIETIVDKTPPEVMTTSPSSIVSTQNQILSVSATIQDTQSDISLAHTPKLYILDELELLAIVDGDLVCPSAKNVCVAYFNYQVPFGMNRTLSLFVSNAVDKYLNYGGTIFPNTVVVVPSTLAIPSIYSLSPITVDKSSGNTSVTIYGNNFNQVAQFMFNFTGTFVAYIPSSSSVNNRYVVFTDLPPVDHTIPLYFVSTDSENSNIAYLHPRRGSIIPPLQCPSSGCEYDNMHCGLFGQCVCNAGFYGPRCASSVVVIDPKHGSTSPDTEYNSTPPTPSSSLKRVYAKISIIELREIDMEDQVVSVHPFDLWDLSNSTESDVGADYNLRYNTSLLSTIPTSVRVSIQYFSHQTNVTFLDRSLQMDPSTVKYGISLDAYDFSQNTNTLELVMSVSLQADSECGSVENGEINDGQSKYQWYKTKLDDISLYATFINIAQIDDHQQTITTKLTANSNSSTNYDNSISYISINIPHYSNTVFIDPDFSVLFDKDDEDNSKVDSICQSNDDGTDFRLIGIIVGSVVGAAAIVVASILTYKKLKVMKESKRNLLIIVVLSLVCGLVVSTSSSFTPSKDTLFFDDFESATLENSKWVKSQFSEANIVFGKPETQFLVEETDNAMILPLASKRYAITSVLAKPIDNKDRDLIVQYEVRLAKGLECGGAYVKLYQATDDLDAETVDRNTPYSIMFGPDKCGSDNRIHFIVRHKNPKSGVFEEKLITAKPPIRTDKLSHLYTLHIRPDNTFTVYVDRSPVLEGNFHTSFTPAFNPPKEVDDPTDSKPSDWIDDAKMDDPSASKPDDWDESQPATIVDTDATKPDGWLDDEPELVPDVTVSKPEGWDDEDDGEWEAPLAPNPKCQDGNCGEWKAPIIKNPLYKGKWVAPRIDNPAYKGVWKARQIANPDYFNEENPYNVEKIGAIGLEIWTTTDQIAFDNFIITHDRDEADRIAQENWEPKYNKEKALQAEFEAEEAKKLQTPTDYLALAQLYGQMAVEFAKAQPYVAALSLVAGLVPILLCIGLGGSKKSAATTVVIPPAQSSSSKPSAETESPSIEESSSEEEEEEEQVKEKKTTPVKKRINKVQ